MMIPVTRDLFEDLTKPQIIELCDKNLPDMKKLHAFSGATSRPFDPPNLAWFGLKKLQAAGGLEFEIDDVLGDWQTEDHTSTMSMPSVAVRSAWVWTSSNSRTSLKRPEPLPLTGLSSPILTRYGLAMARKPPARRHAAPVAAGGPLLGAH